LALRPRYDGSVRELEGERAPSKNTLRQPGMAVDRHIRFTWNSGHRRASIFHRFPRPCPTWIRRFS
jgi:hypothetical protein